MVTWQYNEGGDYLTDYSVSVLGPDYENLRPMSDGGMGELFRAHKRGLDVVVGGLWGWGGGGCL